MLGELLKGIIVGLNIGFFIGCYVGFRVGSYKDEQRASAKFRSEIKCPNCGEVSDFEA